MANPPKNALRSLAMIRSIMARSEAYCFLISDDDESSFRRDEEDVDDEDDGDECPEYAANNSTLCLCNKLWTLLW